MIEDESLVSEDKVVHWTQTRIQSVPLEVEMLSAKGLVLQKQGLLKKESPRWTVPHTLWIQFDESYVKYRIIGCLHPLIFGSTSPEPLLVSIGHVISDYVDLINELNSIRSNILLAKQDVVLSLTEKEVYQEYCRRLH